MTQHELAPQARRLASPVVGSDELQFPVRRVHWRWPGLCTLTPREMAF